MPRRSEQARVLFDEAHCEAWTIRAPLAQAMSPWHPRDACYERAAELLRARDFSVDAHVEGALDEACLEQVAVLVIAHPSDPAWEQVLPGASPRLSPEELDAIEGFVAAGGGLIVLGECEQDKYANNLNELLARFGVRVENVTVSDYASHHLTPHWVMAELARPARGGVDLLARVSAACFYRSATLDVGERGRAFANTSPSASAAGAPLACVVEHGAGRVVVLGDSDLFGDDCIGDFDHEQLWCNLVQWAALDAFRRPAAAPQPREDAHWLALREHVNALAREQEPDGNVDLRRHEAAGIGRRVDAIRDAVLGLAPRFPHQAAYIEALCGDLQAWVEGGLQRPDFGASLDRFRPDLAREDGIEHLVVFPMYKQNGPPERVFEALIVAVPWPEWIARLERTRYPNEKFVPVTLVDHTDGYASECAVLFPEMVSVASRAPNHFGAIFCDRESARFRRNCSAAADVLGCNLPPDAAALLGSAQLSQDAYELWDLIHDRTHSHGDLPFDPFMIRQRMPFWMYALEELRCDLTAFREGVALEREGLHIGRRIQYAILLDRMLRFPITGSRVRNYDGLGGQLLFGYLHRTQRVHWTDNRLTVDWSTVADGVLELHEKVTGLYRDGIQRSKLQHWAAAHDLVATYVPPASGSRWAAGTRSFAETATPRAYVDEVLDDEFPLSLFYDALARRLAPSAAGAPAVVAVAAA